MTKLPAPEQWLISRLSEVECAEMIERHIDYIDEDERSVHLPSAFVRHYLQRKDEALPTLVAVATLPMVLADGTLLAMHGLDRDRGIAFLIPGELLEFMPRREDCTPDAVRHAMLYLLKEWLCDVTASDINKSVLVTAALTLVERSLLPDRPVFFVTAGRRGGGKTTTLSMLIMAVTGLRAAAAAWSPHEEERRKALFSYFLEGVSYILWDNIPRGSQISCPHIERSCTSTYYRDRRLGVSETVATSASAIHFFTGNNIGPQGDLASRSLHVRLSVDRPDPENRTFEHPDPINWTETNRAELLRALYTILLGNPQLDMPPDAPSKTRFKMWWRLIGSAVENAYRQAFLGSDKEPLDFQKLFLSQEEDDEESGSLADALAILVKGWPDQKRFRASDVASLLNETQAVGRYGSEPSAKARELRDVLFPHLQQLPSTKSVGRKLTSFVDSPVLCGDTTLILRSERDVSKGSKSPLQYYVEAKQIGGGEVF